MVDEVVHRLDLGQVVGAAEARMVGRHHVEAAGEEPEEGMPRAGAAGRVEEEQRRTLAAALDVDRAAAELEPFARALGQRAGRVGHAEERSAVCIRLPNVRVRFLDVAVGVPVRCASRPFAHVRALCERLPLMRWRDRRPRPDPAGTPGSGGSAVASAPSVQPR